jgi:hypothetical protein
MMLAQNKTKYALMAHLAHKILNVKAKVMNYVATVNVHQPVIHAQMAQHVTQTQIAKTPHHVNQNAFVTQQLVRLGTVNPFTLYAAMQMLNAVHIYFCALHNQSKINPHNPKITEPHRYQIKQTHKAYPLTMFDHYSFSLNTNINSA